MAETARQRTDRARKHQFHLDQICFFTNRGSSGVTSNNGKRCQITRLKPPEEWGQSTEPEYVIEFVDENRGFGCRECELEPVS